MRTMTRPLAVCFAIALGAAVPAPADGTVRDSLYFRVLVAESSPAEALRVAPRVLPSRQRPINLAPQPLAPAGDIPGGWFAADWHRLPLKLEDDPGRMIYHAVMLELRSGDRPVDAADVVVQISREPKATGALAQIRAAFEGSTNTFYIPEGPVRDAPRRARWIADHIADLAEALAAAGYDRPLDLRGVTVEAELNLQRFRPPELTYDPRLRQALGAILAQVGCNRSNYTGYAAAAEHFDGYLTRYHLSPDHPVYAVPDESMRKALPAFWSDYSARFDDDGIFAGRPLPAVLKLGDEISLLRPYEAVRPSSRFAQLLREEAIALTGDDPTALGLDDFSKLAPPPTIPTRAGGGPDGVPDDQRQRVYLALRALNRATAEMYATNTQAVHMHVGESIDTTVNLLGVLYGGGYSALAWWHKTPDYFRLADAHALDRLQVQAAVPFYPPSGPLTMSMMMPGLAKQAADRHPAVEAEVMHFGARVEPGAYPHVFASTLGLGIGHITTYRFGLRATGWEWYDQPAKVVAMAEVNRMVHRLAPYVVDAERPAPGVAVLHAEASDLWDHPADSVSKATVRGPYFAMRFAATPVDVLREYMLERDELDRYRLLFVGQRYVARSAQRAIAEWVHAGGTLVITPGAMTRDEAARPCAMLDELTGDGLHWRDDPQRPSRGNEFDERETLDHVTWRAPGLGPIPVVFRREVVGGTGQVLGRYENGHAAARRVSLGGGRIVALGFHPSFSYLRGAARSRSAWRELTLRAGESESITGATREGAPYWLSPNASAHDLFKLLAAQAGAMPVVEVNRANIDAQLLIRPERAAIVLADYNLRPAGPVTVRARLPRRYPHVHDLAGRPLDVTWLNETTAQVIVALDEAQAITFDADEPDLPAEPQPDPLALAGAANAASTMLLAAGATPAVTGKTPTPPDVPDTPVIYHDGSWWVHRPNAEPLKISFQRARGIPIVGDWDGDGLDEIGVVREHGRHLQWVFSGTGDGYADDPASGFQRRTLVHGNVGDVPIVGDWDGDGVETVGLVRPRRGVYRWYLTNRLAQAVDVEFDHGEVEIDRPVVGDWDGDGRTTPGLVRDHNGEMRWLLTDKLAPGVEALDRRFGDLSRDLPVVGDWNGDGADSIGIHRAAEAAWYLPIKLTDQASQPAARFGRQNVTAVRAGRLDGVVNTGADE